MEALEQRQRDDGCRHVEVDGDAFDRADRSAGERTGHADDTLVLETTFRTDDGDVRITDCMPIRNRTVDIVREIAREEGLKFKLATITAEMPRELVKAKARAGKLTDVAVNGKAAGWKDLRTDWSAVTTSSSVPAAFPYFVRGRDSVRAYITKLFSTEITMYDGAMGTTIRTYGLGEKEIRGERFADEVERARRAKGAAIDVLVHNASAYEPSPFEAIDAILNVPGLEAIFFGPADLSASYGYLGEWEGPGVADRILDVRARAAAMIERLRTMNEPSETLARDEYSLTTELIGLGGWDSKTLRQIQYLNSTAASVIQHGDPTEIPAP